MPNLLAHAIDIRRWLEDDAEQSYEDRVVRDRKIGRELGPGSDIDRVLGWWQQVAPDAGADRGTGARAVTLSRVLIALLAAGGLIAGISLGSVALAYDGQHPVNVLALLGVLVGIPLAMLLLTLIFLLPSGIPGLGPLREGISVINPGRWAARWLDRYAGPGLHGGLAGGAFARWQIVVFSQWLAVGYFVGVLASLTVLVAVTDLAFGWSSTLELDAAAVHRVFAFLAIPWQGWLPAAVPDAALVEASRFYRLESAPVSAGDAAALGSWWPFVLMTVLVWGLAPRLVLLLAASLRLGAATRSMLCQDAEVLALLDRLTPPRVDFGPELAEDRVPVAADQPAPPRMAWDDQTGVLIWNDALAADQARAWLLANLGTSGGPLINLGVRPVAADALTELSAGLSKVVIFTKGWEPPLLEFTDFLADLRRGLGAVATLVVVPINTRRDGVDAQDRDIWAEFLGRHSDPRLYVLQATRPGAARDGAPSS